MKRFAIPALLVAITCFAFRSTASAHPGHGGGPGHLHNVGHNVQNVGYHNVGFGHVGHKGFGNGYLGHGINSYPYGFAPRPIIRPYVPYQFHNQGLFYPAPRPFPRPGCYGNDGLRLRTGNDHFGIRF